MWLPLGPHCLDPGNLARYPWKWPKPVSQAWSVSLDSIYCLLWPVAPARSFPSCFLWQKWAFPSNPGCLLALTITLALLWLMPGYNIRDLRKGRRIQGSVWAYPSPLADKGGYDLEGISKNGETGPQKPLWSRTGYATQVLLLQSSWGIISRGPDCQLEF